MRWQRTLVLGVAAALFAGCGDRNLVVRVDVLSYIDPAVTDVRFGPVPVVPGGLYTGEQPVVNDLEINMVAGTGSVAKVEDVSLSMSVIAEDSTGSGLDTLRLYLSDQDTDPIETEPALTIPIELSPGASDTVTVDLSADPRITDLFGQKRMRVTLTTAVRGGESGDPLNARVRVIALDAVLIAGRKSQL